MTPDIIHRFRPLRVAKDQQHLIAPTPAWLDQAVDEPGALTFGLLQAGEPVGFVSVIDPRDIPANGDHGGYHPGCGFLWRLMVDHRFQRRGIARRALQIVGDFLAARGLRGMTTSTMDDRPGNALQLYLKAGFVPTGGRLHGEIELMKLFEEPQSA